MQSRIGAAILVPLLTVGCATTRTYAPSEPAPVTARVGMLRDTRVAVGIYDARPDTAGFASVARTIGDALRRAYPDASVILLPAESVHADAQDDGITIRIALAAHVADFGTKVTMAIGTVGGLFVLGAVPEGRWNGVSGFVVTVMDRRSGSYEPETQVVSKVISKPNTRGYRTAREALEEAFQGSITELLLLLDVALAR